ncbi:cytoplasmic protein [Coprinopsis sp. MPI-PUGE-AT-0042]|nr:cytoplasmic protein [Coprinopsis sp. MPI-PUGE-AT-0042]
MPPKSKSIFRQPGVKHFQLVHRSQRDPLINDPEASQHILKPFERENVKKGKSRSELEELLAEDLAEGRQNVGEATLYGVYYDDTEYDYMQHLRTVGVQEEGVDSILIEAPKAAKSKKAGKQPSLILPEEYLPPTHELPRTYESQQGIPSSIAGFQPDMDPHLRQVLEALEDDAFVDDGLEDDFFKELVAEGELDEGEDLDFEFDEYGIEETEEIEEGDDVEEPQEESWEDRFKKFKHEQKKVEKDDSDDEFASEGGDTIGCLRTVSVIGGKRRRRKGSSVASGYSMSSSSMTRHEGLQTLDEKFDQMMLREYGDEDEEGDMDEELSQIDEENSDEAPDLITSRDDFDGMINEFLNDYEILGRKLRPKLEGETGAEKLDTFRRALGEATIREGADEEDNDEPQFYVEEDDKKDRWDCETILTTYSNLENHPRLIRARTSKPVPKIILDPKTGLPSVATNTKTTAPAKRVRIVTFSNSEDTDESDKEDSAPRRAAVGRPRNETKEEKKARKAAVKAAKQNRRVEKKTHQAEFDSELKTQIKKIQQKDALKLKKL